MHRSINIFTFLQSSPPFTKDMSWCSAADLHIWSSHPSLHHAIPLSEGAPTAPF